MKDITKNEQAFEEDVIATKNKTKHEKTLGEDAIAMKKNTKVEEALDNHPLSIKNEVSLLNCIDLSSPDVQKSVSILKQACLDSGFFYVVNHGINEEFMDEVFRQNKSFFDLPLSEKMKLLRNKKHRGYAPILDQHLDPVNQRHGDFKEGYVIGVELPENDLDAKSSLYGPNVWPSSDILPGWRETMEKYLREMTVVAKEVSRIIALALDLEATYFDRQEILGKNSANFKLLHYEGSKSDPNNGIYGAGAHTDFSLMTLLATDDVCGLQICKDKDAVSQKWEFVAPLKGAFIVNIGDMLERWSNCTFRSTLHRVLCTGQERYSIPFFVGPHPDCLVECLPTCQSPENPPKFPPIKYEAYMLQRYNDTISDLSSYSI